MSAIAETTLAFVFRDSATLSNSFLGVDVVWIQDHSLQYAPTSQSANQVYKMFGYAEAPASTTLSCSNTMTAFFTD